MKDNNIDNIQKKKETKLKKEQVSKVEVKNKKENKEKEINKDIQKRHITPAYELSKKKGLLKRDILFFLPKSKKIRITVVSISIILLVSLIIFLTMLLYNLKYSKYFKYEEDMKVYGFDMVYNNGTCKTSDNVTNSEAIKLILASIFNIKDISVFAEEPKDNYENAIWVQYAIDRGVIEASEITKENASKSINYVDFIRIYAKAKSKLLKKELDVKVPSKITNINSFKIDEQTAINDMAINNIIDNIEKDLNGNKKVFKGLVNQMVVNFVQKYNTITINGQKININKEKVPKNIKDYPYTVSSVAKEVYEKPFKVYNKEQFKTPKELYSLKKEMYLPMQTMSEEYYNTLLNIDYNTIDALSFKNKLRSYTLFDISDEDINKYVDYVKQNEIKINGKAYMQVPIIYLDGLYYKVRMKLNFEVINSKTKDNLLFFDVGNGTVRYEKKAYNIYIDANMTGALNSDLLYNSQTSIIDMLVDEKIGIEVVKE